MSFCIPRSLAIAPAIAAVFWLVAPAPARALPVDVTYDISLAFFSPAAGQNVLQGPGSLTVRFANGTAGGHVSAGPLHVQSGTAQLTNNFVQITGLITFMGNQSVTFPGSGAGAVTAAGAFSLNTVGHISSGYIHCTGGLCGLAGFTASVNQNLTSGPRTLNLTSGLFSLGFPSVGPQSFSAMGTGGPTPQGGTLAVTVTGQEISRNVVPEPGTGALVALGLTGLGIAGGGWRARRR